jgi:predicted 2-oxoglutarate/Fe(II)-dependent dioxygenase YbiX
MSEPRSISCSLNLNDDYEGGEFTFFDDTLSYNLGKGDVLMFPSNFMYPHAIKPILSGTRYAIITWFN